MLDDSTTTLQTRAAFGVELQSFPEDGRPLERCVADIEAIVGHAVVIEDVSLLPHWKVPIECDSAICVPVSSMTTPLGTLWIFGDEVRDYDTATLNMIEIIAGRIASELQFDAAINHIQAARSSDPKSRPNIDSQRRRPAMMPALDEMTMELGEPDSENANLNVADWSFKQDGKLWAFSAACESDQPFAEEIADAMQTAFCSLRNFAQTPADMTRAIVDTVCRLEPQGIDASISCALIDIEDRSATICSTDSQSEPWIDADDFDSLKEVPMNGNPGDQIEIQAGNSGWKITWR